MPQARLELLGTLAHSNFLALTAWTQRNIAGLVAERYCPLVTALDHVQAAYAALVANPVPQARVDLLGTLVHSLCAARAVHTLMRLPFAGTVQLMRSHGCVTPAETSFIHASKHDLLCCS